MPWTLPDGVVSGVLQSAWASSQIVADRAVHAREATEHAQRDRVVAAQHQRQLAGLAARCDVVGDLAADVEDLVEVLGMRVALGQPLDRALGHRAEIANADAQLREPPHEPGVADRRRTHVDTAPPLPEVERCSQDRDPRVSGGAHCGAPGEQQRRELVDQRRRPGQHAGAQAARCGKRLHDPSRLAHEQVARGVVPFLEPVLVEGVQTAGGHPRQVERGRARAADVARARQDAHEQLGLQLPLGRDVREARAHERLGERRCRYQPQGVSVAVRAFAA